MDILSRKYDEITNTMSKSVSNLKSKMFQTYTEIPEDF